MPPLARNSLLAALVLASLAGGYSIGRRAAEPASSSAASPGARRILYYRAPMSDDTSPVPRKDPMGMDYVPVYAGGPAHAPGTVALDPARLQTLGVRTEPVRRSTERTSVRASATVEIDQTRTHVVAPRFEGWVAHLHADRTGMAVRAGQPLLAAYSAPLAAARQEMAIAQAAAARLAATDARGAAAMRRLRDAASQRLRNWEVDPTGGRHVVYRSKVSGIVIDKPVLPGARFAAGERILTIADLSVVWAVAHVPAEHALSIQPGQAATFAAEALPGEPVAGRVTVVQPVVDPAARTVDVRIELPNPGGRLRPGLFGQVDIAGPSALALTVPASAVIDSGTRQVVLVRVGGGRFAPREVGIGRRFGERVEILAGLHDGERVVTSANFLIDAESNLQSALEGLGAPPRRPAATAPASVPPPSGAAGGHAGH